MKTVIRILLILFVSLAFTSSFSEVYSLDVQTPQVIIEARIVEATTNFSEELGVDWTFQQFQEGDRRILEVSTTPQGIGANTGEWITLGSFLEVQDWPIITPQATEQIKIPLGGDSTQMVDNALSAFESKGKSNIISVPRVVTQSIDSASILGENVQVKTGSSSKPCDKSSAGQTQDFSISLDGSSTGELQYKEEGLKLEVTPVISSTGTDIQLESTVILSGIRERFDLSGVPVLSDAPVINAFFKTKIKHRDRSELLIFITPLIVKDIE
ncbi:hypothetical protein ACFL1E_00320 [Candidatus Omnitrophota bacterium]